MKRILIALFLVLSLIICLPSCGEKIEENPDFAKYNEMFNKTFENYTIDVAVTSSIGLTRTEKYVVTTTEGVRSVSYKIEKLNEIDTSGDTIVLPEGYVSVTEGVYSAEQSASEGFNVPKFYFSYNCLDTSEISTYNLYSTGVTSIEKFMGLNVSATNGSVKLIFNKDVVTAIAVSFITESANTVAITYTFN